MVAAACSSFSAASLSSRAGSVSHVLPSSNRSRSNDHKQQEKVWASLPDYARERPGHIRNLLTEKPALV
jgi:hypothetical protein